MADYQAPDPLPPGEGPELKELLHRIQAQRVLVYSEGPDHLGAFTVPAVAHDPIREGIRKHRALFIALATEDSALTAEHKEEILRHDPRLGFVPNHDWVGALLALRERAGMS